MIKQRILDLAEVWRKKLVPFPRVCIKCVPPAPEMGFRSWKMELIIFQNSLVITARGQTYYVDKLYENDPLFINDDIAAVVKFLPSLFELYARGCGCKSLDMVSYGYEYGWMMDYPGWHVDGVRVRWCPTCGKNLPTLKDLDNSMEFDRFSRLVI